MVLGRHPVAAAAALAVLAAPAAAQQIDPFLIECSAHGTVASSVLQTQGEATGELSTIRRSFDGIVLYLGMLDLMATQTNCSVPFQNIIDVVTPESETIIADLSARVDAGLSDFDLFALLIGRVEFCYDVTEVPRIDVLDRSALPDELPCGWSMEEVMPGATGQ